MQRKLSLYAGLLSAGLFICPAFAHQKSDTAAQPDAAQQKVLQLAKQVQSAILKLPQYGVFDNIYFGIKGGTVTLSGQASRPILKSSAENVVKKIEGVQSVDNQIEVLPVSPNDDRIRAAVYRRIYGNPTLQRYTSNRGPSSRWRSLTARTMGITNDPPIGYHAIHIIVKNGNVTLKGAVDNTSDSAMAEMQANTTPGVFSVTNDLFVTSNPD